MKKKSLLLLLMLVFVVFSMQAKTWYFKIQGTSAWADKPAGNVVEMAANAIGANIVNAAHSSSPDGDTIFIAGGTYEIGEQIMAKANQVIVGSFAGTENKMGDRQRSDVDGNGIVEPWEFTTPTIIKPTAAMTAGGLGYCLGVNEANITIDGIIFEDFAHTRHGIGGVGVFNNGINALLQNVVMRNSSIDAGGAQGGSVNGIIRLQMVGTAVNCLVEYCTLKSSKDLVPVLGAFFIGPRATAIGCVSRGNYVLTPTKGNATGGGFHAHADANGGGMLINSIAYNNYVSGTGGGIFIQGDPCKVINSVAVNNVSGQDRGPGIAMNNGGYMYNTVAWGNTAEAGYTHDILYINSKFNGNTAGAYNVYHVNNNAGKTGREATSWGPDDLHFPELTSHVNLTRTKGGSRPSNTVDDNSGTPVLYAPKFRAPTAFQGLSQADETTLSAESKAAINKGDYRLLYDSPLINKGGTNYVTTYDVEKDLLGATRTFGTSTDIGAFEFNPAQSIGNNVSTTNNLKVFYSNSSIIVVGLQDHSTVKIFNLQGKLLKSVSAADATPIPFTMDSGVYIVSVELNSVNKIFKIIIS